MPAADVDSFAEALEHGEGTTAQRGWHDATLDVPNCSHQKDPIICLIHTADWQLGKPYGRFDSDLCAALTEARFDAIDVLGKVAAEHDAAHVLVAGDVFDTEGPEERVISCACMSF